MVTKSLFAKSMIIVLATGLLIGHFLLHQFSLPAESALRLSEASMMAERAVPFVDFWDNVSPFYLYFNLVPVQISRLVFCHPIVVTNILTALIFLMSACAIALLSEIKPARRSPLKTSSWAVLIAFVLITLLQPGHFAQANQLFFLLLCPYIVCRACSVQGQLVPPELSTAIGAGLGLAILSDPLYGLSVFMLEICILLGFFPFSRGSFVCRRYPGIELRAVIAVVAVVVTFWMLSPSDSTYGYFSIVTKINDYSYGISSAALNFCQTATDLRMIIYSAVILLITSLPQGRRSILVRLFGLASLLGLSLMILQGATLAYQGYVFLAFSVMTFACAVTRPRLVRQSLLQCLSIAKLKRPLFKLDNRLYLPVMALTLVVFALSTYWFELSKLGPADRYNLRQLGYHGLADRRDLTVFSDVIEKYSSPRQSVAIISLGVRPAFPLLTQLRRTPGLNITWGFPIDTLKALGDPIYGDEAKPLLIFKNDMYAKMANHLAAPGAPELVLVDEGEVNQILEDEGVIGALQADYVYSGKAMLTDSDGKDGHPPLEYVGYRTGFDIYRHK